MYPLPAQASTPEADRPVPGAPQPGSGATGEPAQEQATQEQPGQRVWRVWWGWWRRHPILSGGLGIIVVLFVFISVVGSLGGGGGGEGSAKGGVNQEHKKSTSGDSATANSGQIVGEKVEQSSFDLRVLDYFTADQ